MGVLMKDGQPIRALAMGGGNGSGRYLKYSLDEQIVGEWIDGRPLYQKTAILPVSSANINVSLGRFEFSQATVQSFFGNDFKFIDSECILQDSPTSIYRMLNYVIVSSQDNNSWTYGYGWDGGTLFGSWGKNTGQPSNTAVYIYTMRYVKDSDLTN